MTGRHFNTAGPCDREVHYMLPPERRLPGIREVIEQRSYFVLHAPRQVGKTTSLIALARELTAEGRFAALTVSMEVGAAFPDDVGAAEDAVIEDWRRRADAWLPTELRPPAWPEAQPGSRIAAALTAWSHACPRPLVIFLDEIDALRDAALLSVLRQLRAGHATRPEGFPWSLALVGLRDVRDYKVASGGGERLNTASPFNIKVRSLSMRPFTADEIVELYAQHTAEAGQRFEPDALALVAELTRGQPWLVNALAYVVTTELRRDRTQSVTRDDIVRSAPYHEAAPHLVLMAFLHRVVNGGGRVERELAIGSGRLDLCVEYGPDRLAIEVKTWRDTDRRADPADAGLDQLDEYLTRLDLDRGWLVRFDQRSSQPELPDRLRVDEVSSPRGRRVTRVLL